MRWDLDLLKCQMMSKGRISRANSQRIVVEIMIKNAMGECPPKGAVIT